jgi:hypothetical protein
MLSEKGERGSWRESWEREVGYADLGLVMMVEEGGGTSLVVVVVVVVWFEFVVSVLGESSLDLLLTAFGNVVKTGVCRDCMIWL